MPVSVCSVSAVLSDTLTTSASSSMKNDDGFNNQLSGSAKQAQLLKIEYEDTSTFKTSQESLKSKYIYLKAKCSGVLLSTNKKPPTCVPEKENRLNLSSVSDIGSSQTKEVRIPLPKQILFPRENVQLGWKSSSRNWRIGAGMINVGNTCYLNSALQAIFHVPAFANWLISDSQHRDKCQNQDACIVCAMGETLIESQKTNGSIKPWKVYSKLRLVCRTLVHGRQEDSHEFLRCLIDAMEKSYLLRFKNNKELDQLSKETTPLNQILGGYLKSAVKCLSCQHVSTTFQHFEDLILDIRKANTIEEALDVYFAKEKLEDMGYNCESCKRKVTATKQFYIERAPAVLCIQLKRFIIGSKLNKQISIKTKLDFSRFTSTKTKLSQPLTYKLVSMITHLGASQHSGHYTAIGLADNHGYYEFDDTSVRPISVNNVQNTNAYVILYEMESGYVPINSATCTSTSNNVHEKNRNGFYNNSGLASTITSSNNNYAITTNSISTLTSTNLSNINNSNNNNNNGRMTDVQSSGFIGPLLPPHMQQSTNTKTTPLMPERPSPSPSKSITSTNNNINTTPDKNSKSLYGNQNLGSKLVHANMNGNGNINGNANNKQTVGNLSNGRKRPAIQDCFSDEKPSEKKPNLILPSMPRILEDNTSASNKNLTVNNKHMSDSITSSSSLIKKPTTNGLSSSLTIAAKPIKSLVPYDSDDDSDDNVNDVVTTTTSNATTNDISKKSILVLSKTKNSKILETSTSSSASSSPRSDGAKTPTVIESKTGVWQVSEITTKTPPTSPSLKGKTSSYFTPTKISPINNRNHNNNNNSMKKLFNKHETNDKNKNGNSNTVNQLLKMGHRGYGSNVSTWNGGKSVIDKEITEERRDEKRKIRQDENENDMDRGRVKKHKVHRLVGADNPGFNPFQETQTNMNQRWVTNNRYNYHTFRQNPHHQRNQNHFRGGGGRHQNRHFSRHQRGKFHR